MPKPFHIDRPSHDELSAPEREPFVPFAPYPSLKGGSPDLALPKKPGPHGVLARSNAGAGRRRDSGPARAFLLQDWITIRGTTPVTSITQQDSGWKDLRTWADGAFWIEVSKVTPAGSGKVSLVVESSPTLDEVNFRPVAPALVLDAAASRGFVVPQIIRCVRTPSTAPLSRYVRWRLESSATGTWDATFRIRGVGGNSTFFVPTDIADCVLWLRADIGITLDSVTGRVSNWADQSGNGNHASQSTQTAQPALSAKAMNDFPAIQGNGSAYYMTTPAFSLGSEATFVAAAQPSTGTQAGYARLIENDHNTSYYLGVTQAGTAYKWIVRTSTFPYGTVEGGSVATNVSQIVTGVYASPTGSLYVDGASVSSGPFTAPSSQSLPLYIMRWAAGSAGFWDGHVAEIVIYNRALAATELERLHRYLGARYGVPVS